MKLHHRWNRTVGQQLAQLAIIGVSVLAVLLLLFICCGCFASFFTSAAGGVV